MIKKIITIEGMHCGHCAATVEKAIGSLEGITSAKVNLDKNMCVAKTNLDVSDETIKKAVTDCGFAFIDIKTKKSLF